MTNTAATAAAGYLEAFDRMATDPDAIDDLLGLFHEHATVQLADDQQPHVGAGALRSLYTGFASQLVASTHLWVIEQQTPKSVTLRWLQAARWTDNRLVARSGTETITVNDNGVIVAVRNRRSAPDQGR